jgi:hypothetical protein
MQKPNILLIYTGGTIGMIKDADSGALKAFDFFAFDYFFDTSIIFLYSFNNL